MFIVIKKKTEWNSMTLYMTQNDTVKILIFVTISKQ